MISVIIPTLNEAAGIGQREARRLEAFGVDGFDMGGRVEPHRLAIGRRCVGNADERQGTGEDDVNEVEHRADHDLGPNRHRNPDSIIGPLMRLGARGLKARRLFLDEIFVRIAHSAPVGAVSRLFTLRVRMHEEGGVVSNTGTGRKFHEHGNHTGQRARAL